MKHLRRLLYTLGLILSISTLSNAQNSEVTPSNDNPVLKPQVDVSLEARGAYDFRNYNAASGFGPATIPMKSDANNRQRSIFDIYNATLGIKKALSLSDSEDEIITIVVKTKLKKELSLKSMYADYRRFRIGKATTNFCDPDACDLVSGGSVQVRWKQQLQPSFSYTVAMEEAPDLVIYPEIKEEDRKGEDLQPHKNLPALSANARYEQEKLWHIQTSGLLRFLEHYNTNSEKDVYLPAWGVNMGISYHLIPELTVLRLQGVYGQGIGSYLADIEDLAEEAMTVYTKKNEKSKCKTLDAWGFGVGIVHQWLPKLSSEATYRIVSTVDEDREKESYKHGHAASVNLVYHLTKQIQVGTEYLFGMRKNLNGDAKDAHRMQAVVGFSL
mmetsp:Transcript_28506/g.66218  ORF Transcript_28506/g.66218 Transcript_28506/m.66218 type:complete len:385 (-) Transcript_28506:1345-2499(-)